MPVIDRLSGNYASPCIFLGTLCQVTAPCSAHILQAKCWHSSQGQDIVLYTHHHHHGVVHPVVAWLFSWPDAIWNGHTHESMSCCKWHSTVQSQVHAGWPLWWRQSTGSRLVAVRRTLERSCDGSARSVCPKSAVALSWWQSYWWLPSLAPQVFGTGTSGRRHQLVAVVKKSRNYVNILNSKLGM